MSDIPRNKKLLSIVAEALDLELHDRPAALDRLCDGDSELRRMAMAVLAAEAGTQNELPPVLDPTIPGLSTPAKNGESTRDDLTTDSGDSDAPRPSDAPQIEGYSPVRILGEGGMGVVWEAVQTSTRRAVALKLMLDGRGSASAHLRFQREVQLAAGLEHPFIARIYDSGVDRRSYYYAMELVAGVPLTQYATDARLSTRQAVELFASVCDGVGHAHAHGVIHRDLKPSNILVTEAGAPKLLDFGLAKFVREQGEDESRDMTVSGAVMGTPAYMSPEQADGDNKGADTRGDVYTLGVILFELLTGRMPHPTSGSRAALIRRIVEEEPLRLCQARPDLDGELEAIVMRCLARNPDDRYTSAKDLSAELGRYLRGEPITARAATTIYILRKQIARHRYRYAAGAAVLGAALAGALFYVVSIRHERDQVKRALVIAEGRRQEAQRNLVTANEQRAVALQTLGEMIFSVQRELRDSTVPVKFRQRLIDSARKGLDRLGDALSDPQLQTDRLSLSAMVQMGDLYQAAGQFQEAMKAYQGARDGFERRLKSDPASNQARRDLMSASLRLGRAESTAGRSDDSGKRNLDVALRLAQSLYDEAPSAVNARHDLFAARVAIGDWLAEHGDRGALDAYERAALLAAGSAGADADTAAMRIATAYLRFDGGDAEKMSLAQKTLEAVVSRQRTAANAPDAGPEALHQVAVSLCRLAEVNLKVARATEAQAHAAESSALLGKLVADAPERANWKSALAAADFILGRSLAATGSTQPAIEAFQHAQAILEGLKKSNQAGPSDSALLGECRSRIIALQKSMRGDAAAQ